MIPLALALTLNFRLPPAVMRLQRLGLPRIPAVALVVLVTLGTAGSVAWVMANQLLDVANQLPQYRRNIRNKIESIHAPTGSALERATQSVLEISNELSDAASSGSGKEAPKPSTAAPVAPEAKPIPVRVVESPGNGFQYLANMLLPLAKPVGMTIIVLVFTIFMLIKREDLRNRLLRLAGLGQLNLMTQALDDAARRISSYLVMQMTVNAVFCLVFGVGLYLIGVPNAVLWGVLAALLRLVPYLGTLVAASLPFLLSLAVVESSAGP